MAYLDLLGLIVLAIHGAAVAVINVTDTPDPNTKLGKAYRILEFAAGLVTKRSKDTFISRILRK
jgi:hypothetical protein